MVSIFAAPTKLKLQLFWFYLRAASTPRHSGVSELSRTAGEWIAYLLHQWFSGRRGEHGERSQDPGSPNFLGNNYWVFTKWRCGAMRPSWGGQILENLHPSAEMSQKHL